MAQVFLSHSTSDKDVALHVKQLLNDRGHLVFVDSDHVDGIQPGTDWMQALFRNLRLSDAIVFLNSAKSQTSMWCHTELAIALELGRPIFGVNLEPMPPLTSHPMMPLTQVARLTTTIDDSVAWVLEGLGKLGEEDAPGVHWDHDSPPYPGLKSFDAKDAAVFFGRDPDRRRLLARIDPPLGDDDGHLVVVMGPSGSGKSSLVKAGVLPRLRRSDNGWVVLDPFEPGVQPIDVLASRIVAASGAKLTQDGVRARLVRGELSAVAAEVLGASGPTARRLLVTIDQAEQLIPLGGPAATDHQQQLADFRQILAKAMVPGSCVTVLLTLRSDRLDEFQRLAPLGALVNEPVAIAPLRREDLAEVIERPAGKADVQFEPGMVAKLIDEATSGGASSAVSAMPLLADTLRELFLLVTGEGRRMITFADYSRLGGISSALVRRADATVQSLPPEERAVLKPLLLLSVALAKDSRPAARPIRRSMLAGAELALAERLEAQRLFTGDESSVRVVHDELFVSWPTLKQIIDDSRDDLLLQDRLQRQAEEWRVSHTVLNRASTKAAEAWLARSDAADHSPDVRDFVAESRRAYRRRGAAALGAAALVVVLSLVASLLAVTSTHRANDLAARNRVAESERLGALAVDRSASDPALSAAIAVRAAQTQPSPAARRALATAAQAVLDQPFVAGLGSVAEVSFSRPAARLMVTTSFGADVEGRTVVHVYDLEQIERSRALRTLNEGSVRRAADPRPGDLAKVLTPKAIIRSGPRLLSMSLSGDGSTLATIDFAGTVEVWGLTGTVPKRRSVVPAVADTLAINDDGTLLATGGSAVQVWDVSGSTAELLNSFGGAVQTVVFSPDGTAMATIGNSGAQLWDAETGASKGSLTGHLATVSAVVFSPDGLTVATGSYDDTVRTWKVADGTPIRMFTGHSDPITSLAYSDDGSTLAAGAGSTVLMWATTPGGPSRRLRVPTGGVTGLAFSPVFDPAAQSLVVVADRYRMANSAGAMTLQFDQNVSVVRLTGPQPLEPGSNATPVAISGDGATYVVAGNVGTVGGDSVLMIDLRVRRRGDPDDVPIVMPVPKDPLASLQTTGAVLSNDGKRLATSSTDQVVRLWDTLTGRLVFDRPGGIARSFSPDGKQLALLSRGQVTLLDAATGAPLVGPFASEVSALAYSPDGSRLVTETGSGAVQIWSAADGTSRLSSPLRIDAPASSAGDLRVLPLTFSPDGKMLATAGVDGVVQLWNPAKRQAVGRLVGHEDSVRSMLFTRDGSTLVTSSWDGTTRFWDVASQEEVGRVPASAQLAFVQEGRALVLLTRGLPQVHPCPFCMTLEELLPVLRPISEVRPFTAADRTQFRITD